MSNGKFGMENEKSVIGGVTEIENINTFTIIVLNEHYIFFKFVLSK